MKITNEGKVKLTSIDYRVGNFVYTNFAEDIAFCDINRTVQTKVSKRTCIGMMLEKAIKEKNDTFLQNYGGFIYYLVGLTPDQQFLREGFKAAQDCIERHPDLYGRVDASDEEEKEIVEEMRATQEIVDAIAQQPKEK